MRLRTGCVWAACSTLPSNRTWSHSAFWGPQTHSLYDFILHPISVIDQTPIHGVVIGLVMASIIAVPISVSILYRFRSALPFIAAVLVFGHLPWMAITLVTSCVLASVRPFRLSFRFGSALVAMLPILLYLLLATRGPGDPLSASISPERKLLLVGPWLLAILAACTMMAAIIFIAHLANYRPARRGAGDGGDVCDAGHPVSEIRRPWTSCSTGCSNRRIGPAQRALPAGAGRYRHHPGVAPSLDQPGPGT